MDSPCRPGHTYTSVAESAAPQALPASGCRQGRRARRCWISTRARGPARNRNIHFHVSGNLSRRQRAWHRGSSGTIAGPASSAHHGDVLFAVEHVGDRRAHVIGLACCDIENHFTLVRSERHESSAVCNDLKYEIAGCCKCSASGSGSAVSAPHFFLLNGIPCHEESRHSHIRRNRRTNRRAGGSCRGAGATTSPRELPELQDKQTRESRRSCRERTV